ncbi:MAG: WG repeat-containing protein [bacterium]
MRNLHIFSVSLIALFCLLILSTPALAKEKKETFEFRPFIQKAKYSPRSGKVIVRRGTFDELDTELAGSGYARIGLAEVKFVTRQCKFGLSDCAEINHKDDPTAALLKLAAKSGGDLVVITVDKAKEHSYNQGAKCSNWGETSSYEYRTDWSTGTQATYMVTKPVCTNYEKYVDVDEMLVSSGVVWRKDEKLARQQELGIELSAGAILGDLEMVKSAVGSGADVSVSDMYGLYPLSRAAFNGHEEIVRYLIEKGSNVNGRGLDTPPIFQAAEGGNTSIFRLLLENRAKVKFKDPYSKRTILHAAAKGGQADIVRELIAKKLKVDARDKDGITPLMLAASSGGAGAARLLIENKAKVNQASKLYNDLVANWAPIHFASYMGAYATLKVLLENGADAEAEEGRGYTPLKLADFRLKMARFGLEFARKDGEKSNLLVIKEKEVKTSQAVARALKMFIDGRSGYIDASGKWVIPPIYEGGGLFSEGLAPVKVGEKWGFINRSGKMVIKPLYESTYGFSKGLALVTIKNSRGRKRDGFIDGKGRMVIPAKYTSAGSFSEGLAVVKVGGRRYQKDKGRWGYINRKGQLVIKPTFMSASGFSEGLAPVTLNGRTWGFIDKSGNMVIKPVLGAGGFWSSPGSFSEGMSAVNLRGKLYGYIDKSGRTVIPARFKETFTFSEGLAAAMEKRWGFVDKKGNWAFPQQFYYVSVGGGFSEGRSAVEIKEKKWTYIDKTGNFISKARYQGAGPFRNGVAWVKVEDRWGLIDRDGKFLIKPFFASASIFVDGLASVKVKGREVLGFLD